MGANSESVKIFKALCDENRIEILKILNTDELCATQIIKHLDIGQPTLSHHMKILCDSGVVKSRRIGKQTMYSLDSDGISALRLILDDILPLFTKVHKDIDVVLL